MKYFFYDLLRDKVAMFWIFLYPILLSTIIFTSLNSSSKLVVNVAIEDQPTIMEAAKNVDFFNIVESENPTKDLEDEKIDGFINKEGQLVVWNAGTRQSILKDFLSDFKRFEKDSKASAYVLSQTDFSPDFDDMGMNSFYFSMIAMVSFYAALQVLSYKRYFDMEHSPLAKRINVSSVNSYKLPLYAFISNIIISIVSLILPIFWVKYILHFNPITDFKSTLLILVVANIFSSSIGLFAMFWKTSYGFTSDLLTTFMLLLSFMAGLAGQALPSIIIRKAPWLYDYNPLALITKELSLVNSPYGSDTLFHNMLVLLGISFVFLLCTILTVANRRRKQNAH